jgi:hypothetical protein
MRKRAEQSARDKARNQRKREEEALARAAECKVKAFQSLDFGPFLIWGFRRLKIRMMPTVLPMQLLLRSVRHDRRSPGNGRTLTLITALTYLTDSFPPMLAPPLLLLCLLLQILPRCQFIPVRNSRLRKPIRTQHLQLLYRHP